MKLLYFYSLIAFSTSISAQTVASYVITSAGDAVMSEDGALYLSVGEPMNTELTDGEVMVSQGFLQVTIQGNLLNDEDILEEDIRVYPNPTAQELHLNLDEDPSKYQYQLYDVQGNSLTGKIKLERNIIGLGNYPSGIYLLTLHKDERSSTSLKIIKQ